MSEFEDNINRAIGKQNEDIRKEWEDSNDSCPLSNYGVIGAILAEEGIMYVINTINENLDYADLTERIGFKQK